MSKFFGNRTSSPLNILTLVLLALFFLFLLRHDNHKFTLKEFQSKSNKCQLKNVQLYNLSQKKYPFTIVTGANFGHFCPLQSWLYNMSSLLSTLPEAHRPRIIVYDLGFKNFQINALSYLHQKNYFTEYRLFNFSKYPSFWNINIARGEYAWKPAIIAEISREYPGIIMWLDSGTLISIKLLNNVKKLVDAYDGFFSPISGGGLFLKWTHPGVFKYYKDSKKGKNYDDYNNCNGAGMIFDTVRVYNIIEEWEKCAYIKECIAPKGSSRRNHRQDQTILTYLMINNNRPCIGAKEKFDMKIHSDKYCASIIWEYEKVHDEIWRPSDQDLKEIKDIAKNSPAEIIDIWTKSAKNNKDKLSDNINMGGNKLILGIELF
ncbi:8623_t:CDS:2 [Scutellospora calospora]|uniref:8623_t:CDS:1 n=1 Tax=Scutellospora calospora TaxID=85575 RepID=A0ACA9LG49_9GLOM|nr:8623_t:CDS:2 [Scutellospora calospora]